MLHSPALVCYDYYLIIQATTIKQHYFKTVVIGPIKNSIAIIITVFNITITIHLAIIIQYFVDLVVYLIHLFIIINIIIIAAVKFINIIIVTKYLNYPDNNYHFNNIDC